MPKIDHYLRAAHAARASDLHLATGEVPRVRQDGDLVPLEGEALDAKELQDIMFEILNDTERQRFLANKNLDKSYSLKGIANFRVNVFMTRKGIATVIRTIPSKIPSFNDLGLPPQLRELLNLGKGLVLVTGPTGSGKSTTLAALIDAINTDQNYHILTVEDPVEFVHESKRSLINQREIGSSCLTFSDALKYALREDPDVILVGEMRDLETIALAITAAETGHLVFGTLHTRGAAASVDRIIDSFPANQHAMIRAMLADSLAGVISQALLKRVDGKGRAAAFEILIANHAISNLIREGKTFQIGNIIQTARKEGMILMDHHLVELVQGGIVSAEEALLYLEDPGLLTSKTSKPKAPGQGGGGHAAPKPSAPAPTAARTPIPMTPPPAAPKVAAPPPPPAPAPVAAPVAAAPPPPPPARKASPPPSPVATVSTPPPTPVAAVVEESNLPTFKPLDEEHTFRGSVTDLTNSKDDPTLIYDTKKNTEEVTGLNSIDSLLKQAIPPKDGERDLPPAPVIPMKTNRPGPPPLPQKKKAGG
jgi:twitching motility protein PilT